MNLKRSAARIALALLVPLVQQASRNAAKREDARLSDQRVKLMEYIEENGQELALTQIIGEYKVRFGPENVKTKDLGFGRVEVRIEVDTPEGRVLHVIELSPA